MDKPLRSNLTVKLFRISLLHIFIAYLYKRKQVENPLRCSSTSITNDALLMRVLVRKCYLHKTFGKKQHGVYMNKYDKEALLMVNLQRERNKTKIVKNKMFSINIDKRLQRLMVNLQR